ncbi:MAG: hypothetical protein V4808_12495 [Pseudomonadota bacterium]
MSTRREIIDWQGVTLSVDFTPNQYGVGINHIELRVIAPEGAIIPVTDTGYRSHFFSDEVGPYGGPVGYVGDWLDRHAASPEWKRRELESRQLRLF